MLASSEEGPPPPGVDPKFDALVEAELARRRKLQESPQQNDFEALVEAEMARQREEMPQQQQRPLLHQQQQNKRVVGRREAQAAYAAELRRQMEEKRDRDKLARASEVAASRERLFVDPGNREGGLSPSPSAARSRFVRDIYGETNVAGALGATPNRRASPRLESVITRPPRDADVEAKRRALALEQKRALEAQIAERKAQKAREDAERRVEEERELREAQRLREEERARKESEDAKRKADEQRRFDDLLAAQQAAAARRKQKRVTPREKTENSPPSVSSTTRAPRAKKLDAEDEALDAASSQFQAAVAAEVRRLRGERKAASSPQPRNGGATNALAALAKKYEQEDPSSLSLLANSSKSTLRQKAKQPEEEEDDWCEKSLAGESTFVPIGAASPFTLKLPDEKDSSAVDTRRKKDAALKDHNDADDFVGQWQRTHPVQTRKKRSEENYSPQLTAEISLVGNSHFQPTSLDTSYNNFSTPRSPPEPSASPTPDDQEPSSFFPSERRQWDDTYVPSAPPVSAPPPEAPPSGTADPRPTDFLIFS